MSKIELCGIKSCTQCGACESICPKQCISYAEAKEGFVFPVIERSTCVECGLCMKSCHQITPQKEAQTPLHTYAAWSLNDTVRRQSSSGGVFTEIAQYVFRQGGVVFGAVMNEHLKVYHTCAENTEQLSAMRGSKYVQSEVRGVYKQVQSLLKQRRMVLFVGTPCQVAGLYAYLKKDYENLLTCDLVCHGVPSQKSFDTYCQKVNLNRSNVQEVGFRYTQGWGLQMAFRSHLYSPSRAGDYKWKNISPHKSYYLRAFTRGLMFNEACYACRYARPERVSDITLADFWGIGDEMPFEHPVQKGVSLLLVNTEKGGRTIVECSLLFTEERTLEEAVKGNHNLSKCSNRPQGRDTYCLDAEQMRPCELMKKYNLQPSWKDYLRPLKRKINR